MSAIYWHSQSEDDGIVRGSERAWMGTFAADIAKAMLNPEHYIDRLVELLPPMHDLHGMAKASSFPNWYAMLFGSVVNDEPLVQWRGNNIDVFSLVLNTVLMIGNDAARLMARLHGQCEIHAYIEGSERNWLANIIERGRMQGLLRPDMGWESVVALLRCRDDEPIVTSYSVTESFPNPNYLLKPQQFIAASDEDVSDKLWEWWDEKTDAERWEKCLPWLRKNAPRLQSDKWEWPDYYFQHGLTVLDILAPDYATRLDTAFKLEPVK